MIQPTLSPYLGVDDAQAAISFYAAAFEAQPIGPCLSAGGKLLHAELQIGDSVVMLADEMPEHGHVGPKSLGGTPVRLSLYVDDVDLVIERAVAAGAKCVIPAADQFYGYRSGRIEDPFGHVWIISTKKEHLSTEEMQRRLDEILSDENS